MKDNLLELIKHTNGLGVIELLKIIGTDKETKMLALADDRTVIINGTFNTPVSEFIGTFGMPSLSTLKTILSNETDYNESAIITVEKNSDGEPTNIHFETKSGDYKNDYRLMAKATVEDRVKPVTFKGATWAVEFEPTIDAIARLKRQAQAISTQETFTVKSDGNDIRFYFGDPANHSGDFVFTSNSGKLTKAWSYPVKAFTSIVELSGDNKKVRFSDQGVAEITLDSGIATYQFLFPALQK
jgi:hypothetical protein